MKLDRSLGLENDVRHKLTGNDLKALDRSEFMNLDLKLTIRSLQRPSNQEQ